MNKKFTALDRFVLETISKILVSKGCKFTPFEVYERIKQISDLDAEYNLTQTDLYYLWTKYNFDPPKPPYDYYFETQNEAECFAKRAKNKHNVSCDIDLIDFRKWKVTEKKELSFN